MAGGLKCYGTQAWQCYSDFLPITGLWQIIVRCWSRACGHWVGRCLDTPLPRSTTGQ